MTDVRVGIVSWNTAALLGRCLDALPAALDGLDAEVVVLDNASADDSVAVARSHQVRVVVARENLGYARGMNEALDGTDAPVLIALNPDTEPGPGTLRALHDRLVADDQLGCVVPRLLEPDGSLQHSVHRFPSLGLAAAANLVPTRWLRGALGRRLWIEGSADHRVSGRVDWAVGAVHVLRTAATGTRPYRERWFMYVEDLDLCWRLRAQGWGVALAADVAIPHVGNAAGAQRWGSDRTRRWLTETYDWRASAWGPTSTRLYAALNLAGALLEGGYAGLRARLRDDAAMGQRARAARRTVPVHARAILRPAHGARRVARFHEPGADPDDRRAETTDPGT